MRGVAARVLRIVGLIAGSFGLWALILGAVWHVASMPLTPVAGMGLWFLWLWIIWAFALLERDAQVSMRRRSLAWSAIVMLIGPFWPVIRILEVR